MRKLICVLVFLACGCTTADDPVGLWSIDHVTQGSIIASSGDGTLFCGNLSDVENGYDIMVSGDASAFQYDVVAYADDGTSWPADPDSVDASIGNCANNCTMSIEWQVTPTSGMVVTYGYQFILHGDDSITGEGWIDVKLYDQAGTITGVCQQSATATGHLE